MAISKITKRLDEIKQIEDSKKRSEEIRKYFKELAKSPRGYNNVVDIPLAPWDEIIKMPELTLDLVNVYYRNIKISDIGFGTVDWANFAEKEDLIDFLKENKNQIDWASFLMNKTVSEELVEEVKDIINWERLSRSRTKLDKEFIIDYKDYLNINDMLKYQTIPDEVLAEKIDTIDIDKMCRTQKEMSEGFITELAENENYKEKINWHQLKKNYEFSDEFKKTYREQLYSIDLRKEEFNKYVAENNIEFTDEQIEKIEDIFDAGIDASLFADPIHSVDTLDSLAKSYESLRKDLTEEESNYYINILKNPEYKLSNIQIEEYTKLIKSGYDISKIDDLHSKSPDWIRESTGDMIHKGEIGKLGKKHPGNEEFYKLGYSRSQSNFLADCKRSGFEHFDIIANKELSGEQMRAAKEAFDKGFEVDFVRDMLDKNLDAKDMRMLTNWREQGIDYITPTMMKHYDMRQKSILNNDISEGFKPRLYINPRVPAIAMQATSFISKGVQSLAKKFRNNEIEEAEKNDKNFDIKNWLRDSINNFIPNKVQEISDDELANIAYIATMYAQADENEVPKITFDHAINGALDAKQRKVIQQAYADGVHEYVIKQIANPAIDANTMDMLRQCAIGEKSLDEFRTNLQEKSVTDKAVEAAQKEANVEKEKLSFTEKAGSKIDKLKDIIMDAFNVMDEELDKAKEAQKAAQRKVEVPVEEETQDEEIKETVEEKTKSKEKPEKKQSADEIEEEIEDKEEEQPDIEENQDLDLDFEDEDIDLDIEGMNINNDYEVPEHENIKEEKPKTKQISEQEYKEQKLDERIEKVADAIGTAIGTVERDLSNFIDNIGNKTKQKENKHTENKFTRFKLSEQFKERIKLRKETKEFIPKLIASFKNGLFKAYDSITQKINNRSESLKKIVRDTKAACKWQLDSETFDKKYASIDLADGNHVKFKVKEYDSNKINNLDEIGFKENDTIAVVDAYLVDKDKNQTILFQYAPDENNNMKLTTRKGVFDVNDKTAEKEAYDDIAELTTKGKIRRTLEAGKKVYDVNKNEITLDNLDTLNFDTMTIDNELVKEDVKSKIDAAIAKNQNNIVTEESVNVPNIPIVDGHSNSNQIEENVAHQFNQLENLRKTEELKREEEAGLYKEENIKEETHTSQIGLSDDKWFELHKKDLDQTLQNPQKTLEQKMEEVASKLSFNYSIDLDRNNNQPIDISYNITTNTNDRPIVEFKSADGNYDISFKLDTGISYGRKGFTSADPFFTALKKSMIENIADIKPMTLDEKIAYDPVKEKQDLLKNDSRDYMDKIMGEVIATGNPQSVRLQNGVLQFSYETVQYGACRVDFIENGSSEPKPLFEPGRRDENGYFQNKDKVVEYIENNKDILIENFNQKTGSLDKHFKSDNDINDTKTNKNNNDVEH